MTLRKFKDIAILTVTEIFPFGLFEEFEKAVDPLAQKTEYLLIDLSGASLQGKLPGRLEKLSQQYREADYGVIFIGPHGPWMEAKSVLDALPRCQDTEDRVDIIQNLIRTEQEILAVRAKTLKIRIEFSKFVRDLLKEEASEAPLTDAEMQNKIPKITQGADRVQLISEVFESEMEHLKKLLEQFRKRTVSQGFVEDLEENRKSVQAWLKEKGFS